MNKVLQLLLADDDRDDRFFFEKALRSVPISCNLSAVQDGEQLLDFLFADNSLLPEVIFMDLNMPRRSGGECLAEIKRNERFSHIPIIIYSTSLHEDDADSLYGSGAHYYLRKCDFAELPDAIHKILLLLAKDPTRPDRKNFIIRNSVFSAWEKINEIRNQ